MTQGTVKAYGAHWAAWVRFLAEELEEKDPYLQDWQEVDKPTVVCLFLSNRYGGGLRGKQASAVTAGIRYNFMKALVPTAFMESAIMTAARAACRMSTSEVRAKKDQGPDPAVKIALCESMLSARR